MHYQIKDVMRVFEEFAPSSLSEDFDNTGLLIGDSQQRVTQCLITLDVTEEVVDEAIDKGCNLIVSHHPIMLSGIKKITGRNYQERLIAKAIKHDIAIFAAHTNADRVRNGVSGRLAKKLGLINTRILSPLADHLLKLVVYAPSSHADQVRDAIFDAGGGSIGRYDRCSFNTHGTGTFRAGNNTKPFVGEIGQFFQEPEVKIEVILPSCKKKGIVSAMLDAHPYEEVAYDIYAVKNECSMAGYGIVGELSEPLDAINMLIHIKKHLNCDTIRHTALIERPIKKVALCGGSGSFLLKEAMAAEADIFISGDFKYHQFFDAEGKLIIADIGHFESEQFTKEVFFELLTKKLSNFALCLSKVNTNPIKYF